MQAVHLFVSGRVQGVMFRESMRREATRLGAVGWVRNLADGRVEAWVQGDPYVVDLLLAWTATGPPGAQVRFIERNEVGPDDLAGFDVRR